MTSKPQTAETVLVEAGPPWRFARYVNGVKMAEGCRINNAATFDEAAQKAADLFRDAPGSVFVLQAAALSQPLPREGEWVTVPREPSDAMLAAFHARTYDLLEQGHIYDEYDSDPARLTDDAAQIAWAAMLAAVERPE